MSELAQSKKEIQPKKKNRKFLKGGGILSVFSIVFVFLLWFTLTEDGLGLIRPVIFPSPKMVIHAAISTSSLIGTDVMYTMLRVVAGLVAGTVLGIGVGVLVCFNQKIYYLLNPLIESARPVPVIAMIPFFLMWFGIGEIGKFLLVTLGVFSIIVINTIESIRSVPPIYVKAGQTLGAKKTDIYKNIIIPSIVPSLIGPIRVCVAMSFTLVVAAEFMGAQAGMGYRILQARKMFNTDVIFLGVVMFGILSALVDTGIRKSLDYITRWTERS